MTTALRARQSVLTLLLALGVLAGLLPAAASAKVTFGYGDNRADMFSDSRWSALPLKDVRRTVDWDVQSDPVKLAQLDGWMNAAKAAGARPLLAIDRSWSEGKGNKKPTVKQYSALIKFLKGRYPFWKTLTPWNEANYRIQPTAKSPKLAWDYYQAAKKACKGCTVTSPALLIGKGVGTKFTNEFFKLSKGKIKLWAVHAYGDQNRLRDTELAKFTKKLPGKVWITEAAGWVKFLDTGAWPYSEDRAAKVIDYVFKSAKKHSKKINRWYFYQWRGDTQRPEVRWDSGVLNADGSERKGYAALVKGLKG